MKRALAVTLLVLAAVPAPAAAAPDDGRSRDAFESYYGKDRRLTVHDATEYTAQVAAAVDAWNRARTGVTLSLTEKRRGADIVVRQKPKLTWRGKAAAGLGGPGNVKLSEDAFGPAVAFQGWQVRTVTHELGHALGLGHTRRTCSIMGHKDREEDTAACAGRRPPETTGYHCGPSEENARAVAKVFRVKRARPRSALECPIPAGLFSAAVEGPATGPAPATLRVRNTGTAAWMNVTVTSIDGQREVGMCPQLAPELVRIGTVGGGEPIGPGQVAEFSLPRECYDPERRQVLGPPRYSDLRLVLDDLGSALFGPPMSFGPPPPQRHPPEGT